MDLLFPRCCPVCGRIVAPRGDYICPGCLEKLVFVKRPVCLKCGKEVVSERQELCFDCSKRRKSFEYGMALMNYNEAASASMVRIKYKNKREYLDFYGEAIWRRYGSRLERLQAQALVPVPIHTSRRRQRGFNQAEVLAEILSGYLGIPVRGDFLVRNKRTAPQKSLDPTARLKNLEEAFGAGMDLRGLESVILVDDIYTTGSTAEACTRVLKKAGVKRVYLVVVCIGGGQ